jgi:hypothetical protein
MVNKLLHAFFRANSTYLFNLVASRSNGVVDRLTIETREERD